MPQGLPPAANDKSFSFLHEIDHHTLRCFHTAVIATDADGPGDYAALQLAARLMTLRPGIVLWRVDWSPGGGKDVNEVLVGRGERGVWICSMNANQMTLRPNS